MYNYGEIIKSTNEAINIGKYKVGEKLVTLPLNFTNEFIDRVGYKKDVNGDAGNICDTHSFIAIIRQLKKTLIINAVDEHENKINLMCTLPRAIDKIDLSKHYGILSKNICFFRSMEYVFLEHPICVDVLTVKSPKTQKEYKELLNTVKEYDYKNIIFPLKESNPGKIKNNFKIAQTKSQFDGDIYLSNPCTKHLVTTNMKKSWFKRFLRMR